jgi:hypothetical protein
MSLRNLAANGGDWIGSWLMQSWHWSFSGLVFISAGTTLLVLLVVPLISVEILKGSDMRSFGDGEAGPLERIEELRD